ncbi:hypothetical protein H5410_047171 [Solanum commersonii]|uniref:F-box associated beta-propeller type 3 domain-containing protein n=1 Tax=Solanum commersonii TaxID=4109 RepID=A0A9J5XEB1_SOLCO|nr:hypothetical protein H5410_047171 [Solanum commersonii]
MWTIPILPEELVGEILSRLSVKFLLKFRSLLYESDVTKTSALNYPMKNSQKSFRSMNSINGLICLVDWSNDLFLWNPSIRKYKKLPDSKTNSMDAINFIYGFGYDKFREDYKVVACTYYHGHSRDVEVQIYIVQKWIKVEQPSYEEGDYDLQLGMYGSDLSGYINNNRGKCVSLWVMKKSWTKILFSIKYDDSSFSFVLPFFMSNKGEIVVCFASTNNFMIYNPNDESLCPAVIDSNKFSYAKIYIESLVSPFST